MTITITQRTELVVFDFDETIVDCNTDTFIDSLAPEGKIPEEFRQRYLVTADWTDYMQQVFTYLHQNGVREADYKRCLANVPFVPGVPDLIRKLNTGNGNQKFEVIILSDANTFFINFILEHFKLTDCFRKIFTNPAHFDASGCLRIERYHVQDFCKLSARNLCKGHVLEEYIAQRAETNNGRYHRVAYCGDGSNDLCPSLRLKPEDVVFPRSGYPLDRLTAARAQTGELKAKRHPFQTGQDIWNTLLGKNN